MDLPEPSHGFHVSFTRSPHGMETVASVRCNDVIVVRSVLVQFPPVGCMVRKSPGPSYSNPALTPGSY